jgi:Spy/CpxP family protein refolding chaperone
MLKSLSKQKNVMKKSICLIILTLTLCLATVAARADANVDPPTKESVAAMTPEQRQARVDEIKARITELRAEDRSQMTKVQRKAYRTELRALKKEASFYDVLYIGVGALIVLIVILLVVL